VADSGNETFSQLEQSVSHLLGSQQGSVRASTLSAKKSSVVSQRIARSSITRLSTESIKFLFNRQHKKKHTKASFWQVGKPIIEIQQYEPFSNDILMKLHSIKCDRCRQQHKSTQKQTEKKGTVDCNVRLKSALPQFEVAPFGTSRHE
jgi:hypothetical protein